MPRRLVTLALLSAAAVSVAGACTHGTAAAFTAARPVGGNAVTVDALANYFSVTPGSAVQPGTATPVATGSVNALTLAFGAVPSARTFTSVFTITNVSAQSRTATLALTGAPEVASTAFASSGATSATLAAGASTTLSVTTSSTVAGHGSGTLRLGLSGTAWLYRDYALTLDESPEAPASLTAAQRAGGRIDLAWAASSTTTNLAGYDVYRSSGGGAYAKQNATPLAGTSFADSATADGTSYSYKLRAVSSGSPVLASLDSSIASAVADATAPGAPTAVSLANGGGTGGAYVNAANKSSVSVSVTLPGGSLSSDAISVTLGDGTRTVSGTTSAPAGAGTVTVAGLDASSLADATLTITATSTDAAGNVSSVRTATVAKDTVAPGAPTASYVDNKAPAADQITGSAEAGATVRATQTAPTASGPYGATATGGAYTVTVANQKSVNLTYTVTATDAAGNSSAATAVSAHDVN